METSIRQSAPGGAPPGGRIAIPGAQTPIVTSGLAGLARGGTPLWLPLPFLLTGALGAAAFGLLLPFVAPQALLAPDFPRVLAVVHIATLGWLTMTIMGASLQLAPVILVSPLRAARFSRAQYPIYVVGVALLITGFWMSQTLLLIFGGALVVLAVAHYAVIMGATLARGATHPLSARYLAAAVGYLCVVVSLGFTAALNFHYGFLGEAVDRLLLAHITVGVVGWLTCTLMGVSYTLVRMFALVHTHADDLGRRIFLLLNVGVIGLALGFALGWAPLQALAGLSLIVAVWLFAYDYARMLHARKRKPLDVTQRHALVAVGYLAVVAPAGVAAALFGAREPVVVALGLAALVGWLGQSMIGYLYKIVPFLVWQSRYGPLVGRQRVPLMRDLIHQRVALVSFWLINGALPVALVCALCDWSAPLQVATAFLGVGLLSATANVLGALAPRRPAPAPAAA
ncbi:MAG TPA: hypothetical protein VMV29_11540 [Ktedonobacterales bacterium]|nr:hypothetical protein [Ktedonobacterales bacterium]